MNGCWGEVGWSQGAIQAGSKMVKAEAKKKKKKVLRWGSYDNISVKCIQNT